MANNKNKLKELRDTSIFAGGMLAASVLFIQAIASHSQIDFDKNLQYALLAFSAAIPGLAIWYFLTKNTGHFKLTDASMRVLVVIFFASVVCVTLGLGLFLLYYYRAAGITFLITALFMFIYFLWVSIMNIRE
jgi:cobalamin synthase